MNSFKITVATTEYRIEIEKTDVWAVTIRFGGDRYVLGRYTSREAALLETLSKISLWESVRNLEA